jgi:hypothetical protein
MPFTKVSEAIREVMDQCYVSSAPLATLGTFIDRLDGDPDWSHDEVHEVRHKAIRILGILTEDTQGELPNRDS